MVGSFRLAITDHYLSKSKVKGTPFVRIMLRPIENLVTKEACDATYSYPFDGYLTENTFDRTMDAIEKALGQSVTEAELASGAFVGREINGKLEEEANQQTGKKYTKVRWINPLGGVQKPDALKPSPSESKLIADTLRGKMLARNSTKKKTPVAQRPADYGPAYQAPSKGEPDMPVQDQSDESSLPF